MKKIALLGLTLIFVGSFLIKKESIMTIVNSYISKNIEPITIGEKNSYYRDYDFEFVQTTDDFSPKKRQDILNIFYTAINAGKNTFTFYCPKEYENCIADVSELANNQDELSNINNFVHPYNGFSHIETEYDSLGKVTITILKSYTNEEINAINNKISELLPTLTNSNWNSYNNIKSIHDYIINNSKYDSIKAEGGHSVYKSDIAYGPLFQGYAICGGYTDLMELFLEKLNIKSYKVSSTNHIWNAVQLDNTWYHLDLTWDDPVASNGLDYLEYNYFLVNTTTLLNRDTTQHTFNQLVFSELKGA